MMLGGDCNCVPVHRLAACLQLGTASDHISSEVRESYLAVAPEVGEGWTVEGGRANAEGERTNQRDYS